jgi:BCD family chlorophyll transporter-like MFS transporter
VGLALGAWGAVQATAAGIAVALGGIIRDAILGLPGAAGFRPEVAYTPVFGLELALLLAAVLAIILVRRKQARLSQTASYSLSQDRPGPNAVSSDPMPPDRRPRGGEPHDHRRLTAL